MSNTPRTDAQKRGDFVHINFARELEQENAALRADKERLDWLGSQKGQPWLCWDIPLRLTREVIDAERKEAQP